ncbi:prenyltransferase/squalene oxidase repeat-containing protein [Archangium sp.]|uniref:prenyltransferase/squalene oxidase repeat-containing protein n=1 Tax=Archangium sp. TaxID=1872627 RepID=UPI002D2A1274|nr:prenyltransferase/squalene oxidase repeat-containing protein [Archangium sp.]HYO58969.1 prenyltransferase/squalene oxidase repeat-containing protein [Archangium sp.]
MQAILKHEEELETAFTEALARALRFLENARTADGRWLDFRFRFVVGDRDVISSQWVTAYVGQALARVGADPATLEKPRDWLMSHAHPGGGWGFSLATPADADSTANVVRFLAHWRGVPGWDSALGEACAQLLRYWDETGGGFRTYRPAERPSLNGWASYPGSSWCDVHLCVTALAGQALHAAGDPRHHPVLEACARMLRDGQSSEGFWEAYWWHGRTYATFHAARLLCLLGGDSEPVARAARWLLGAQQADGGWGNGTGGEAAPFHTALALAALLLDGGRQRHGPALHAGLRWLLRAQQPDGGWTHVPIMRMPRPEVHEPWKDPEGCLLLPVLTDRNRLFTTATVVSALADWRGNP